MTLHAGSAQEDEASQTEQSPDDGALARIRPQSSGRRLAAVTTSSLELRSLAEPSRQTIVGDARKIDLPDDNADLVVTSPPYWQKRDYGHDGQIGQESTPAEYVAAIIDCLKEWRRVLRSTGSIFLNVGDTYHKRSLAGIPGRIEAAAVDDGWVIRNRIIWAKTAGMPEPARNRLANRHEYVIHLTPRPSYYYDLYGYAEFVGNGANPGDVWQINPERNMGNHLAPFPRELVRRAVLLACPPEVCSTCGTPRTDCGHGTPARGVVLDPFMGTGTTLEVATEMGRDAIGVDLVPLTLTAGSAAPADQTADEAETCPTTVVTELPTDV